MKAASFIAGAAAATVIAGTVAGAYAARIGPFTAQTKAGGAASGPDLRPVPTCGTTGQPAYWTQSEAWWKNKIPALYHTTDYTGYGKGILQGRLVFRDPHTNFCGYFTTVLLGEGPRPQYRPCEYVALHGSTQQEGQPSFVAPSLVDSAESGRIAGYRVGFSLSVIGYHGPGTARYSQEKIGGDLLSDTGLQVYGRGQTRFDIDQAQATVRPDGSGSIDFSGHGTYEPAGGKTVETSGNGSVAWRCLDPAYLVISPRSQDGENDWYGTPAEVNRGALDFANQAVGQTSEAQELSLTNSGPGPLFAYIRWRRADLTAGSLDVPEERGYRVTDDSCIRTYLLPGKTCRVKITFTPKQTGRAKGLLVIDANVNEHTGIFFVGLDGRGTEKPLPQLTVDSSQTTLGDTRVQCNPVEGAKFWGWGLINPEQPVRELRGQVLGGQIAYTDFTAVHNAMDYNAFIYPDANYQSLVANPSNFKTGDPYEGGRIEVEWEVATGKSPGGLPSWAWPQQGDRVYAIGNHIADCAHGRYGDGFRSEIHPTRLLAVFRNAALSSFGGADARRGGTYQGEWATHVDVFASSYGGPALKSLGGSSEYQVVNDRDVQFNIAAPPKPSYDAVLNIWPPNGEPQRLTAGIQGQITADVIPPVDPSDVDNFNSTDAVRVTVHFPTGDGRRLMTAGRSLYLYWTRGPQWTKPTLRHYRVTVSKLTILSKSGILSNSSNWSVWAYVNEQGAAILQGSDQGPLTTPLGMPYFEGVKPVDTFCSPKGNCRWQLTNNVFDITVVDGQPVRIAIRGIEHGILRLGTADAAGTAERIFVLDGKAQKQWWWLGQAIPGFRPESWVGTEYQVSSYGLLSFGDEDVEANCSGSCFRVTFKVQPAA